MIITNTASLSYRGTLVYSNPVTGEILSPLSITKSSSVSSYSPNGHYQYQINVVNRSLTAYTGLTILDDLGSYHFQGGIRFPTLYVENSAELYYYSSKGISPGTVSVNETTDGLAFTFDLPGNTVVLLTYDVSVTVFAPLAFGSQITNTASLLEDASLLPIYASLTLPVAAQADLAMAKYSNTNATIGNQYQISFILTNYGNKEVSSNDYTVISDFVNPALTEIKVTADNVAWVAGTQYEYNESQKYFQTVPGAIVLAPATFTQDDFGRWNTNPSSLIITITGIVAAS